jgi:hypothetical protein
MLLRRSESLAKKADLNDWGWRGNCVGPNIHCNQKRESYMTESIEFRTIPEEKIIAMQSASDALIDSMRFLVEPKGDLTADQHDSLLQHTVFGNSVIRVLISMSEKLGPLDLSAIRAASFQAIAYVSSIAEPVNNDMTGDKVN